MTFCRADEKLRVDSLGEAQRTSEAVQIRQGVIKKVRTKKESGGSSYTQV